MSRTRTTWDEQKIATTASVVKTADPYTMNQPEHAKAQPAADAYVTGTPSTFAEDVAPNDWAVEYSNGQTKRDAIGLPAFRPETFNHPEKTAALNEGLLIKKADLATTVARLMLGSTAVEAAVEDQAFSLMYLPDAQLIETHARLAGEQQQDKGQQDKQAQDQQQTEEQKKQAQDQQQADEQKKQAAQQQAEEEQKKQAHAPVLAALANNDMVGLQAAVQAMVAAQVKKAQDEQQDQQKQAQQQSEEQQKQAQQQAEEQQKQAQAPVQSAQQMESAIQAMVQSAVQQALSQQQPQMAVQAQPQQQMAQQPQQAATDDVALLDEMLGGMNSPNQSNAADQMSDIVLEPAQMDVGEVSLTSDDDVLKTLFAGQQEVQEAEQAQQAQGQKQAAHAVRTASTRTVGTRPSGGVSKIGGVTGSPAPAGGGEIGKLASLWSSAPDVSEAFGIPKGS